MTIHLQDTWSPMEVRCFLSYYNKTLQRYYNKKILHTFFLCFRDLSHDFKCCKTRWHAVTQHGRKENNASAVRNKTVLQLVIRIKIVNIWWEYIALIFFNCFRTSTRTFIIIIFFANPFHIHE